MIINILNKHNLADTLDFERPVISVDRTTPLGNPAQFRGGQLAAQRDEQCKFYLDYFVYEFTYGQYEVGGRESQEIILGIPRYPFWKALCNLYFAALHDDIDIACWCAPKRCHAETIYAAINNTIKSNYGIYNVPISIALQGHAPSNYNYQSKMYLPPVSHAAL